MFFLHKQYILSNFFVRNVIYFYFCAHKTQNMLFKTYFFCTHET